MQINHFHLKMYKEFYMVMTTFKGLKRQKQMNYL